MKIKDPMNEETEKKQLDEAFKLVGDTPRTDDQFRDATKMVSVKLSIRPYSYECGDGCCSEYGEKWSVDGKEVASGPCEHNRMQQLLHHLGFNASIVGENEDGEEVWEL